MYASVRRYDGVDPGDVDEIVRRVEEGFIPIIAPVGPLTSRQMDLYLRWTSGQTDGWTEPEFNDFDAIPFRFAPGRRKQYPDGIPHIGTLTL